MWVPSASHLCRKESALSAALSPSSIDISTPGWDEFKPVSASHPLAVWIHMIQSQPVRLRGTHSGWGECRSKILILRHWLNSTWDTESQVFPAVTGRPWKVSLPENRTPLLVSKVEKQREREKEKGEGMVFAHRIKQCLKSNLGQLS